MILAQELECIYYIERILGPAVQTLQIYTNDDPFTKSTVITPTHAMLKNNNKEKNIFFLQRIQPLFTFFIATYKEVSISYANIQRL